MDAFNWLDYVILTVIGLSALFSLMKGFVREAISLTAWIVAIAVSIRFMAPVSTIFVGTIHAEPLRWAASFLAIFVAVLLVGAFLKLIFGRFVREAELGGVDRFLGLVFGLARGSILVVVVLFLFRVTAVNTPQGWEDSRLLPHFDRISVWMIQFLPISKILKITGEPSLPFQHSQSLPSKETIVEENVLKRKNISDKEKLDFLIGSLIEKEGRSGEKTNNSRSLNTRRSKEN